MRRPGFRVATALALLGASAGLGAEGGCATDDLGESAPPDAGAEATVVFDASTSDALTDASKPCVAGDGAWCPVAVPIAGVDLTALWGSGAADVWTVGYPGVILHWSGASWMPVAAPKIHARLMGVVGRGPSDVWFGATRELTYHFDGRVVDGGPEVVYVASPIENGGINGDDALGALWQSKDGAVWGAGGSTLYRSPQFTNDAGPSWEGVASGAVSGSTRYAAGYSDSPTTTYAVGDQGLVIEIVREDGGEVVTTQRSGTVRSLRAVWGSAMELVVCGEGGTILRAARTAGGAPLVFSPDETNTVESMNGLWGVSAEDLWAVGDHGTVLHFDGKAWTPDPSVRTTQDLYAVWGTGEDDVWAVGRDVILHRTGRRP